MTRDAALAADADILGIYLAHRRDLVRYANAIVGDEGRAEDVVQEAWLRLRPIERVRQLDEPVGYLYRVVRNLAVDGRRRQQREATVVQDPCGDMQTRIAAVGPTPETLSEERDDLLRLAAAIAELPTRTRLALEMRRLEGCKLKEIAARLGVSVTVAHGLLAEGIAHCRRRVRPPLP